MSPHVLEKVGNIEYVRIQGFVVHVPNYMSLQFLKNENNVLYVCDMARKRWECLLHARNN